MSGKKAWAARSHKETEIYSAGFLVGRETAYQEIADSFRESGKTRYTGNSVADLVERSIRFRELIEAHK